MKCSICEQEIPAGQCAHWDGKDMQHISCWCTKNISSIPDWKQSYIEERLKNLTVSQTQSGWVVGQEEYGGNIGIAENLPKAISNFIKAFAAHP